MQPLHISGACLYFAKRPRETNNWAPRPLYVSINIEVVLTCVYVLSVQVRFSAFKVVNVLAVCSMPFSIRLIDFTKNNRPIAR